MSDGIKISYAYDPNTDRQISIAKAQKGIDYECVECCGRLRKRCGDGTSKREHFYHIDGNGNCNITEESSLHLGAKLYLKECLEEGKSPVIFMKTDCLPDTELKKIMMKANIIKFQISAENFLDNMMLINSIEETIDGSQFVGDMVSHYPEGTIAIVWEILVSHQIEDEKRRWLNENNIPYIELIPSELGVNSFQYEIVSFNNLHYFDSNRFKLENMADVYGNDIIELKKTGAINYLKKMEKEFIEFTSCNISQKLTLYQKNFMKKHETFDICQTILKHCSENSVKDFPELKYINIVDSRHGPIPTFNKIMPDSVKSLVGEFFKVLGNRLGAMGWVNSKNVLYGIRFSFLDKSLVEHEIDILDKNHDFEDGFVSMVNLRYLNFNKQNYRYELTDCEGDGLMNNLPGKGAAFSASVSLLKKTMEALIKNNAKIQLITRTSSCYGEAVTGFKISGVYPSDEYEWLIDDFVTPIVKNVIKSYRENLKCKIYTNVQMTSYNVKKN